MTLSDKELLKYLDEVFLEGFDGYLDQADFVIDKLVKKIVDKHSVSATFNRFSIPLIRRIYPGYYEY